MDDDSPEDVVHRHLAAALFPGHPLGRETAGERGTVEAITADDVRSFFSRWYRAAAMTVVVVGPDSHDVMVAAVEASFAGVAAGGEHPVRVAPGPVCDADLRVEDDIEQTQLVLGYRAVGRDDPCREALEVCSHALGGGPSSRLFEQIREQRGLAYSVYSGAASYADAGSLTVYAGTSPEHVDTVRGLIEEELDRILASGITDEELAIASGYLAGSFVMGLEDTGARMGRIGAQLATRGNVIPVRTQVARWKAVTLADVAAVAGHVLRAPRVVALLGPDSA